MVDMRMAKGRIVVAIIILGVLMGCTDGGSASSTQDNETPDASVASPVNLDGSAVMRELGDAYSEGSAYVKSVEVDGADINIRTSLYADSDAITSGQTLAAQAVQLSSVRDAFPNEMVIAYVWPAGDEFYITRATATYSNGVLGAPLDTYVNDVLK